jgi:Ca2+-binding EF-hand superfamily protein
MKASGQNPTEAELAQIIKEVDLDGDGTINFDGISLTHMFSYSPLTCNQEFIAMMTGKSRAPPPEASAPSVTAPVAAPATEFDQEEDWRSAWDEFDESLKGSITASQMRQVMQSLGETVSDKEIDELINDVDGEEKISCELNVAVKRRS